MVTVPAMYSQENAILVVYQIGRLSLTDRMKFSGEFSKYNIVVLWIQLLTQLRATSASINCEPFVN